MIKINSAYVFHFYGKTCATGATNAKCIFFFNQTNGLLDVPQPILLQGTDEHFSYVCVGDEASPLRVTLLNRMQEVTYNILSQLHIIVFHRLEK